MVFWYLVILVFWIHLHADLTLLQFHLSVVAGIPPCCYTAGICCYLTWKDHYTSFIWCAFNKVVAVVTVTHDSHVILQWCNQRFSIPVTSVQREV